MSNFRPSTMVDWVRTRGTWACVSACPFLVFNPGVFLALSRPLRPKTPPNYHEPILVVNNIMEGRLVWRLEPISRSPLPARCTNSGHFLGSLGGVSRRMESSAAVSMGSGGLVGRGECLSLSRLAIDATLPSSAPNQPGNPLDAALVWILGFLPVSRGIETLA